MKFGKRLASQVEETLPEWRDKFLSYKQLKKRLKLISAPECFTEAAFESPIREGSGAAVDAAVDELKTRLKQNGVQEAALTSEKKMPAASPGDEEESSEFSRLLEVELDKFNTFFTEKEEEYVIRLQELKNRIEEHKAMTSELPEHREEVMVEIRRDFVTFHGEMVLLFNYSSLNYTGLVKILKKHDKRTGTCLRSPFIQRVLKQPFFTTELLSKLVQECERNLQNIFPVVSSESDQETQQQQQGMSNEIEELKTSGGEKTEEQQLIKSNESEEPCAEEQKLKSSEECEQVESIYKSTLAALQTLKDLRKGSSTYTAFSLPPLEQ